MKSTNKNINKNTNSLAEKIKDNYLSIVLGILVILVILSIFTKTNDNGGKTAGTTNIIKNVKNILTNNKADDTKPETPDVSDINNTYTVKKGDSLWKIAEKQYGSGYNWVDIASTNKLKSPGIIVANQKLILPDVQPKSPTTGTIAASKTSKITITGNSYTVKKGDHLWKIAVKAYGDGHEWLKIAKYNKIKNPGYIEVGQIIKLPR
jgi:nucleoid-associated protein YgaU